ncbi:MAG: hypothetical protein HFI66_09025 [Lachnospiraceae bacterium]|jgi:hypothetical protein|nr:hypothetical protein [Lachnospiraceae bacterium]
MRKKAVIGVYAMKPETYSLSKENEEELQKKETSLWRRPAMLIVCTLGATALDGTVLFNLLDKAMFQSEHMGWIMGLGIAVILNLAPLFAAYYIYQALYKLKRGAALCAGLTILSFFILFGSTCAIRASYADTYNAGGAKQMDEADMAYLEIQIEENQIEEKTDQGKKWTLTLFLSVEPLATSLLNFVMAYISEDKFQKEREHLRLRRLELEEAKSDLLAVAASLAEPESYTQQQLSIDERHLEACQKEIYERCRCLEARARQYLAEYLQDPSGASRVLAELEVRDS